MQEKDGSGELMEQVRRVVAVGAVALSVFLVLTVGDDSDVSDLHVAVVSE